MTDQELREMVRESIARQLGGPADAHAAGPHGHIPSRHASFALLPLASGGDGDGACLIEPSVRCNHCGYCLSYGH
ncbi:MAG TPA: hypothetical protein VGY57_16390 [Vicinamibacterales bacterium]|nr:hypothetical protein [Vicinamibacterales bacterium]